MLTKGCLGTDTPGVHLQHSLQHLLPPEHFKELLPTGRLKPYHPLTPAELALEQQITSSSQTRCGTLTACIVAGAGQCQRLPLCERYVSTWVRHSASCLLT